jgi:N-acetyl-gamma-glutamyl-phosphate reductase
MIRVGILGATGYTGLELVKILLRHSEAQVAVLTTRQEERPHLAEVHPQLAGRLDLRLENLSPKEAAARADCVFCCLPHGAAARAVPELLAAGAKVIDFSADYRLNDADTFRQWYHEEHPDPQRLGKVVYGLPEWFREQIRRADLVANPGCYPTSAILPLAPFLAKGLIEPEDIIIDSKSGVSGAGRTPKLPFHFPECNESISAYGVGTHRHTPEIDQILGRATGRETRVIFTPHLVPMDRGILSVIYARPTSKLDQDAAMQTLHDKYDAEPFVRVVDHLPATRHTAHTNFCDITARIVQDRLVLISAEDNLIKGASGAAVQNFNVMYGFQETAALL